MAVLDSVRGEVLAKGDDFVVVDCGGVGFRLRVPRATANSASIGVAAAFRCRLTFKDDAFQLYGFATDDERDTFVLMQSVSGLGPEKALALLNALDPAQISQAVEERDSKAFERVKGVGSKLAQRIVVDLEGRFARLPRPIAPSRATSGARSRDLAATLVTLGYSRSIAERTADSVVAAEATAPLDRLVKAALRRLNADDSAEAAR